MNPFTKLWTVKMGDWERGLVVAIITVPLTIIMNSAVAGSITFNWKVILAAAIAGGVGYLLKNLVTGENGKLLSNK